MKTIKFLLYIAIGIRAFGANGQTKNNFHPAAKAFGIVAPKLKNVEKFKSELPKSALKEIHEYLEKDGASSVYLYTFRVNRIGKVEPYSYYLENNKEFDSLKNYIVTVFNKYEWLPGHKKDCVSCKISVLMQLKIYFKPNIRRINVIITYNDYQREMSLYKIKM